MIERIERVLNSLEKCETAKQPGMMVGFDGYIDELVNPVKKTIDADNVEFFETISDFGSFISSKANKSCSIELRSTMKKIGGNAPIFSKAAATLGIRTECIGAFGYPEMNELFAQEVPNLTMTSVADPGYCTALEFKDGKVMLADNKGIEELSYEVITERMKGKTLCEVIEQSDVIALMNWSEVIACTGIWKEFLAQVFPKVAEMNKKKIFIDISDCSNRNGKDIRELAELLVKMSQFAEVTLSLNRNEFECLVKKLGSQGEFTKQMEEMKERLEVKCLVIHDTDGAYGLKDGEYVFVPNKFNENPKILTGGGDNFNAGLAYGIVQGVKLDEAILIANATSGYYVTNAQSPTTEQLKGFMRTWKQELEENR